MQGRPVACATGAVLLTLVIGWPGVHGQAGGGASNALPSNPTGDDEQTLREAGLATDGPALLEFFRKRTLDSASQDRIQALVRELGDNSFKVRAKASTELTALGMVAKSFLVQAVKSPDPEVSRRAEECLRIIDERETRMGLPGAAARLIAARKPAGAAQVLLAYLPFAENDSAAEEVVSALAAIAVRDGKPEEALVAALSDKLPARRAAAAEALCRAGVAELRADVRKLLQDADLTVRLRAALALATAKDKDAVPVVIDLLVELPQGLAWQAEDLLFRLAGEEAPAVNLGRDQAARRKCRDAWAGWWRENGPKVDLAKLEGTGRTLGYTLLLMLDDGRAIELDANDRPRLQINDLLFPLDAQMLPGDRLLVAEYKGNRVTERNRKGEVLWEKRVDQPLVAQRLPNGNTFIATQAQLLEVDREGREVASYPRPAGESIMKAQKLPNGEIACITTSRRFVRMDISGKELQNFQVNVFTSGGRIDVLPGYRVLVPEMQHNRVAEYDAEGKVLWSASFSSPVAAVRLPNGHTLVTSMNQPRAVELDRDGKEVWEYKSNTRITRAFRR